MILFHEIYPDYTLIYNHSLSDKSLPLEGWFHRCFMCSSITCKEINYFYKKKSFKIVTCQNCHKDFNNIKKEKLNRYIEKFFIKNKN